ncbi:uncharacterized protein PAC_12284 [Phialocephala subalpina]|uniref:Cytochrome P450 n=1 Tax=Phialocephala subalpina TaxID=576137 RepID=A0A1L7XBP4_9HELO|nr:uncharacterized protein PAC_12284 [Phialocephala subalpina]
MNFLREGHKKYLDKIFQVWTTGGYQLVLPPKYIEEAKMMPDDILRSSLVEFIQGRHTIALRPDRPPRLRHLIKHEVIKDMHKLFPGLKEETPMGVYPAVCRLVFRVSGRAFAGQKISHDDDWMMMNISYAGDAFQAALVLRYYPDWLRPLVKYFTPEVRQIWKYNAKAGDYLAPLIEERNQTGKQPGYEKPNDTLKWVQTTRPEYLLELREEIQEVLKMYNGEWTVESMPQLKKMDNFIKETQRYQPTIISFQRKALQSIALSDGTRTPKGAYMMAASDAVSHDPNIYENPDEFDSWRYYKMRQAPENENKYQLVSIGNTKLHFGGGRYACPERWFVSHEPKLILSALIMAYNVKLKEGEERPKNILFQSMLSPNPMAEIMFKSRA